MSRFNRYNTAIDSISAILDSFYTYPFYFSTAGNVATSSRYYQNAKRLFIDETHTHLEIELPGYDKNQIKVYTEKNDIVVTAKNDSGHSKRSYDSSYPLREHEKVEKVKYENGILQITLVKVVPDEYKRKEYQIE